MTYNPISTLIVARSRPGETRLERPDSERNEQRIEAARNEALYEALYGHGEWVHECPGCNEFTASGATLCDACLVDQEWC